MDALEDKDIKLQKASVGLFDNFNDLLPRLLWYDKPEGSTVPTREQKVIRRNISNKELWALLGLIEPFQEYPQLLDPQLANFMQQLTSAFLRYLNTVSSHDVVDDELAKQDDGGKSINLLAAISKLIYTLTKIRGQKVITRFLPNEPRYLETVMSIFENDLLWQNAAENSTELTKSMTSDSEHGIRETAPVIEWEVKYVGLIWISHLLLTPFDLVTISNERLKTNPQLPNVPALPEGLGLLTERLLYIGLRFIGSPGKDREGAAGVLVRLMVRKDTRSLLSQWFLDWACQLVASGSSNDNSNNLAAGSINMYLINGVLIALAGVLSSSERTSLSQEYIHVVYEKIVIETIKSETSPMMANSQIRKLMCKIQRNIATLLLPSSSTVDTDVPENVESIIDTLLNSLGDRDTLVRYAASKALSAICLRLPEEDGKQVLEALHDMYDANVYYPHRGSSTSDIKIKYTQDLSQVSATLWHGLTLTLATLLTAKMADTSMLPRVIQCITTALSFEQRKATHAVGSNVRDAACYAAWSLARNYSTKVLLEVEMQPPFSPTKSVPQLLAEELVKTACLDSSGNIRRAASAALQELIGRHPDTVHDGIALVQAVDYSSVARRSKAATTVCNAASVLGTGDYWNGLVDGILEGGRGLAAQDSEGRKFAAIGLGGLMKNIGSSDAAEFKKWSVVARICKKLKVEVGADIELRHGVWYALAEVVDGISSPEILTTQESAERQHVDRYGSICQNSETLLKVQKNAASRLRSVFNGAKPRDFVNPVSRRELTCEAACRLIMSMSHARIKQRDPEINSSYKFANLDSHLLRTYFAILDVSLECPDESVLSMALSAVKPFFLVLSDAQRLSIVNSWLRRVRGKGKSDAIVKALGIIFHDLNDVTGESKIIQNEVLDGILKATQSTNVDTRVAAFTAINDDVFETGFGIDSILLAILQGLDDYSIDLRGDVGSWVRIECIEKVKNAYNTGHFKLVLNTQSSEEDDVHPISVELQIAQKLVRLSVEKLDKVRIKACIALFDILSRAMVWSSSKFKSLAASSTFWLNSDDYFQTMLALLDVRQFRVYFLEGYITSAGGASESTLRASSRALVKYMDGMILGTTVPSVHNKNDINLVEFMNIYTSILSKSVQEADDRILIPALIVLAEWLNSGVLDRLDGINFRFQPLFNLIAKAHFKTGNIPKLSAAVQVYAGLISIKSIKSQVVDKLLRMFMHPFPKIRYDAAEALYLSLIVDDTHADVVQILMQTDWMGSTKHLKGAVATLRARLEV